MNGSRAGNATGVSDHARFVCCSWFEVAERLASVAAEKENNKERTNHKTSRKYAANPSP